MKTQHTILSLVAILFAGTALAKNIPVTFNGDFRYRHERMNVGDPKTKSERERLRLRLKGEGKVTDDIDAVIRLTSGGGSKTSTNQTLDGEANNKTIELDQAYANWKFTDGAHLALGKMKNFHYAAGKSDLVFDSDWTPEGMTLGYKGGSDSFGFDATLSRYWMDQKSGFANTIYYLPQLTMMLKGPVDVHLGAAYHKYSSADDSTVGGHFTQLQYFAEVGGKVASLGWALYADMIQNTGLPNGTKKDKAYLLGGQVKMGKVSLSHDYRRTEANALNFNITDGDVAGGASANHAKRTKLSYKVNDNVKPAFMYSSAERSSDESHYDVFQADINFYF